jgi:hypothetical protein
MTAGQKVEILGLGNTLESVAASVEAFNRTLDRGGQGSGGSGTVYADPQLAEIMAFAPPRNLEAILRPCPPPAGGFGRVLRIVRLQEKVTPSAGSEW